MALPAAPVPEERGALLSMSGITKRFPGVVALRDVSLSLARGEVLALVGENGAGKSTLMKILAGAEQPDQGEILVEGRAVALDGVGAARRLGIALIHQELMLAPNLDVTANIFLGNEPRHGRRGGLLAPLARARLDARAEALLGRVGLRVAPTTPVARLTPGQMQLVEIAKALSLDARVIVMDEPTSSLTAAESEHLLSIIRALRDGGVGVIYISHRLGEVLALSDRVMVLRDGKNVGERTRAEARVDEIVAIMVGRPLDAAYFRAARVDAPGPPILAVEDLVVAGADARVSFTARRGEILGFAGLVGSGRTELMETIFGARPALGGRMLLAGEPYRPRGVRDAIARGVYLAPEDRKTHGLVLPMSVAENTSLPGVGGYGRLGWLDRRTERRVAEAEVARLKIKTPSIRQRVVNLSGGNQQKVVLGKWLAMSPRVLILDEPTRGVDVGAKAEIYRHVEALSGRGITILMVSSDMEEVVGMSDRVVVMRERRVQAVLSRADVTPERIAALMTGSAQPPPCA
ncbi:MAG TPA: sugar ABC transporter ATP-binding protein [Polyangiaceae bacterium]|nr:sugar ABC transporter ATP-binding protein [Polyangiaceae bacterium]